MFAIAFVLVSLIVTGGAIVVTAIVRDDEFSAADFFKTIVGKK